MVSNAFYLAVAKAAASGQGAYKNKIDKEYGSMVANITSTLPTLIFAAAAEAKGDDFWGSLGDFMKAKPLQWLENAIAVIAVLDFLNGLSSPDKGLSLTEAGAAASFDSAIKSLRLAMPDESKWSGPAAEAYRNAVKTLQQALIEVKQADAKMQEAVQSQALRIINLRSKFAYTKVGLMVAMAPALVIYAETWAGRMTFYLSEGNPAAAKLAQRDAMAVTRKFQLGTIAVAMTAIAGFLTDHTVETLSQSAAVASLAGGQYDAAAKLVPSTAKSTPVQQAAAASTSTTSKLSSFQRIPDGAGNSSNARSYPVAGGAATARATSYPVAGGSGTPGGAGTVSTPSTPSAPPATAATSATAGTGHSGQGVKPGVGGAPIPKPAKQTDARGEEAAGKGNTAAAEGAEAARRAPIEVPTAVAGHAQRPTSPTSAV
ncbi:EspA/EspE family type VII secretion system effector [Mycobacterium sp. 050272]|uniref:EspA/EspE family type VII secretion system effector n=1 Tax=Mycobacterium sp. 050272 TaxID=3142488 RepID=UPI00318A9DDF